ncbi:nose resistant to fluoxetine protein 6-like [Galendromus occidentalis]|uniref:Nose resistant to fluoxetine protein 6-like n=1 Tax=Galendromus occidentalis TaxID=34638 RepID=A0AAJ6QRP3_9ACAR|nr:nose resistant to fluoxetine protein 6-like [Galendromus occidentalis]
MGEVVLVLTVFCTTSSAAINPVKERLVDVVANINVPNTTRDLNQYEDLQPIVEGFMKRMTREMYPLFEDILFDPEIPAECGAAFQKIMQGMQSFQFWAYRFVRSSGGLPTALDGKSADLGDYDSCLAAEAKNSNGEILFTGRYCTLFLSIDNVFVHKIIKDAISSYSEIIDYLGNSTTSLDDFLRLMNNRIGVCVPSTCRGEDLEYVVQKLGGKYGFQPWVPACRALSEDPPLSAFQIGVIIVTSVLVILTIVGIFAGRRLEDLGDVRGKTVTKIFYKVLHAFSLERNLRIIFRTDVSADVKHLTCVHGLRAISAFYILYAHSYLVSDPSAQGNPMQIFRWIRYDITMLPVYMGFYVVDTFFCIAGLMTYRSLKQELSKEYAASVPLIVFVTLIRRWIRLSIPAVFLVAFYMLYPALLSGPGKDLTLSFFVDNCARNWWSIPAMVGNFFGLKQCILHLWYVPADFQATAIVVIPVILLIRGRYRLTGSILLIVVGTFSCVFISVHTWLYELPPFVILLPNIVRKVPYLLFGLYNNSLSHLMSTVIGVFLGHFIDKQRTEKPRKYTRSSLLRIWLFISILATINYFLPFYWQTGGDFVNVWAALYAGFSRVIWCSFIGWLIFVCATGNGGIVNRILTSKVFIPLSRVSYSFYLLHVLVMGAKVYHQRNLTEARHYLQAMTTVGDFGQSFFFAVIFFCLVEAPTTHIEKMVYLRICEYVEPRGRARATPPIEEPSKSREASKTIEKYRL